MWRGSIPSTLISAVGTPPSSVTVTVTSAGSGCADSNSRSSCRCSLTSLPTGKADCRRTASRFSRCSALTEDLPSVGLVWQRSRLDRSCLHRLVEREETDPAVGHLRSEPCARLAEECAGDEARRNDCLIQVA